MLWNLDSHPIFKIQDVVRIKDVGVAYIDNINPLPGPDNEDTRFDYGVRFLFVKNPPQGFQEAVQARAGRRYGAHNY